MLAEATPALETFDSPRFLRAYTAFAEASTFETLRPRASTIPVRSATVFPGSAEPRGDQTEAVFVWPSSPLTQIASMRMIS